MRNKFVIFSGLFIILSAVFFYFFLIWRVSNTLVEQILFREELAAKAGSKSISIFVENLGFQISIFATRTSIVSPNPQDTPKALKTLVDGMRKTPITGVMLADSRGIVLYGFEKSGPFAGGEDISDREYFKWAKSAKEGEEYIGAPITSRLGFSKGRYIIPLAVPVIKEGEFNGVLVVAFFVDELTTQYLNESKISSNTRIYIIDKEGLVISSPTEKLLGLNYLDYIKNLNIDRSNEIYGTLRSALASDTAGTTDIYLPDETKSGFLTRFFVGYAPIKVQGSRWLLVIATPASDALASLSPLRFRDLGIIGLVVSVSIVIAFYLEKTLDILGKRSKVTKDRKESPRFSTRVAKIIGQREEKSKTTG